MGAQKVDARILAGEFVLADADGDEAKAQAVLARVSVGEVTAVEFIVALSRTVSQLAQAVAGDRWRDDLRMSLNAMDVEEVAGDVEQ